MADTDFDVRGCKIHLRREGAGAPLLYLHGAQGLAGWEPALAALGRDFDVIAPDMPGFGGSAAGDRIDTIPDVAFCMLDLLDALGLGQVHVVGQCLGGWVAMEMALRCPGRFTSLNLVNSAGIRIKGTPRADMFICNQDELLHLLFAGDGGAAWLAQWGASPALMDEFERNGAAAAKYSWQPRLASLTLDRWLHRIDAPTQIVWGEQNQVIPLQYAAALNGLIPGSRVVTLPGCGHLAHHEQPQALAAVVAGFAREIAV